MRIWQKEGDSLSSNVFPRKTFRQLTGLVRQTRRVSVEWRLVRYVRSIRGHWIDVQSWHSQEMNLFGMLALMVAHSEGSRERGLLVLFAYAPRQVEAARVRCG